MNKAERQIVEWMRGLADKGEGKADRRLREIDPARPSSLPDARKIVAALEEIAILRIIADEIETGKHREEP